MRPIATSSCAGAQRWAAPGDRLPVRHAAPPRAARARACIGEDRLRRHSGSMPAALMTLPASGLRPAGAWSGRSGRPADRLSPAGCARSARAGCRCAAAARTSRRRRGSTGGRCRSCAAGPPLRLGDEIGDGPARRVGPQDEHPAAHRRQGAGIDRAAVPAPPLGRRGNDPLSAPRPGKPAPRPAAAAGRQHLQPATARCASNSSLKCSAPSGSGGGTIGGPSIGTGRMSGGLSASARPPLRCNA